LSLPDKKITAIDVAIVVGIAIDFRGRVTDTVARLPKR
jgi:hypothetical protein